MANHEAKLARKARHALVIEMLTACHQPSRIVWAVAEQHEVAESTVWKDIRYVKKYILPSWYEWEDKRQLAIEAVAKLDRITRLALDTGQLKVAIDAIKQVCALQGLFAPVQVIHRSADFGIEAFNAVRQIYSLPVLSEDEFEERRQGVKRATVKVLTEGGGNGVH